MVHDYPWLIFHGYLRLPEGTKYYKLTIFRYPLLEVPYMKPIFQGYFFLNSSPRHSTCFGGLLHEPLDVVHLFHLHRSQNPTLLIPRVAGWWAYFYADDPSIAPLYLYIYIIWYLCVCCNEQLMSKCKRHMNELTQLDNARYGMVYRHTPVSICS